jgi:iron complex transport system substrate-binding protein
MSFTGDESAPPSGRVSASVLVVVVLVAAGVAVTVTALYFVAHPQTTAPSSPTSLTVVDDLGRTVQVPYDPARVAVFGASNVDLLYRLGLRSHIVGVDCYAAADGGLSADYSSDQIALWNLSASMCVQVAPVFVPSTLANLTPSLVLSATIISVPGLEQISSELGIPVVFLQPATLSGVVVDSSVVGEIFGVQSRSTALNAQLNSELYNATNVAADAVTIPTVLVTYFTDENGYWTYGPGTFGESLIELTGARSISADAATAYPELSPAQVLQAQPDWIVYGTGFGLNESSYSSGPDWSNFQAVQVGNVTGINSNWLTEPDPTMILEGIPALLAIFHPSP